MPRKAATPTPPEPVALDVRLVSLDTLSPDPDNVRVHPDANLKAIRDSLTAFGQQRPLVVMADGLVLAGNGTLEAARQLGWSHIAVQVCTLPLDQARAYAVADNRTAELASWNETGLATLLRNLHEQALPLPGWDEAELRKLCGTAPVVDVEPDIDRAAVLREQYGVQVGQLWACGQHRVICGDCTDKAIVERLMQGTLASLVITDPPYGVAYADKNAFLNTIGPANRIETPLANDHLSKDATQALWKAAFQQMAAVMAPGAVVYCFMPQGGDQMMMMMMMEGAGIEPRHELIWLKNNHVLGRVDYAYKHEPILYAWKEGGHHFYGDFQTSILEYPKPQKSDLHPTTKPTPLIAHLMTNSSQRGEAVYDPFLGSGTTLVACEQLQRVCYAMEIDPSYTAVSLHRWSTLTNQTPVLVEP